MGRREFITLLGGASVAWPLAARAEVGKVPRIGMVYPGPKGAAPPRVDAVVDGLRGAGYSQVEIVLKVADGDPSRIAPLVTETIASNVDVFFATGPALVRAARAVTQTVPIVAIDLETDCSRPSLS